MEAMIEVGVWYCIIMIALALYAIVSSCFEKTFRVTAVIAIGLAVTYFMTSINVILLVKNHPLISISSLAVYLIAGIVWALCKWYIFVRNKALAVRKHRIKFIEINDIKSQTFSPKENESYWQSLANEFDVHCIYSQRYADESPKILNAIKPNPSDNKERITFWISYWPVSVILTVIDDPLRKFVENLYEWIRGSFKRIADRQFSEFDEYESIKNVKDDAQVTILQETCSVHHVQEE